MHSKTIPLQLSLFQERTFPTTRYQGSKAKLTKWIWDKIKDLEFDSVLDAFGGTGSVAYMLKIHGKEVTYNDILRSNANNARALIENSGVLLSDEDVALLFNYSMDPGQPTFIADTFSDVYFTDEENLWIDRMVHAIEGLLKGYKKNIAYYALFQSCIIKRPYNLFHRKNLYIRTNNVKRSFGNKVTWDTPFEVHFRKFVHEANTAVFENGRKNRVLNLDAMSVPADYDFVYIDTPYVSGKGVGVNYFEFYHFLEGILRYDEWQDLVDRRSKHLKIKNSDDSWTNAKRIPTSFENLLDRFAAAKKAISYRSNGVPSVVELVQMIEARGQRARVHYFENYKYVLSTQQNHEVLIVVE